MVKIDTRAAEASRQNTYDVGFNVIIQCEDHMIIKWGT